MKLLIIPGFSLRNKDWAETIQKELAPKISAEIHSWQHWQTGSTDPNWIDNEVKLIAEKIKDPSVNLLAKSIGTLALARTARMVRLISRKIILCGLPVNDIDEEDQKEYQNFSEFVPENLICFQNETDPHGSFTQVQKLMQNINTQIPVISKPRDDHEYPYAADFLNFLLV